MNAARTTSLGSAPRLSPARVCATVLAAAALTLVAGCWSGPVSPNTLARPAGASGSIELTASSVPPMAGKIIPPAHGAYLGIFRPPAPFQMTVFDTYASQISPKRPAILMWFQQWAADSPHEFDSAACVSAYQRGVVPMITWEPWDAGTNANNLKSPELQPQYQLGRITAGDFDPYIHRFAHAAAAVRGPVMIRLMHEMNGRWYPWGGTVNGNTPDQFVPAWRHIHDIFDQEGASNVTWVWCINHDSRPNTLANRYAVYYPGDKYVDWVALSGFNFGTAAIGSTWQSFDHWYDAPLAYLKTLNKPVLVAEIGSVEQGGSKAAWLTDAYNRMRLNHPEIKAVNYYDAREAGTYKLQDWSIASSPSSLAAFRASVSDPYYLGAPAATLDRWTSSLSDKDWVYLRSFAPVY